MSLVLQSIVDASNRTHKKQGKKRIMAKKTKESSKSKSKSNAKHNGVQHDKTKKTASGKRKRDRTTATAAATGAGAGTADEARELKRKLQELRKVAGVHHRAA